MTGEDPLKSMWPGVPSDRLGAPLFKIEKRHGDSIDAAAHAFVRSSSLDEFLSWYQRRPAGINRCGIRLSHALALWLIVKRVRPSSIIESGINAGHSTWILRGAAPHARIFALDPAATPICDQPSRWIDRSVDASGRPLTTYLVGSNFTDMLEVDWQAVAQPRGLDWATALVYEDDHQPAYPRLARLYTRFGLRHYVLEDNYKPGEGALSLERNWSLKQVMARGGDDSALWLRAHVSKQLTLHTLHPAPRTPPPAPRTPQPAPRDALY